MGKFAESTQLVSGGRRIQIQLSSSRVHAFPNHVLLSGGLGGQAPWLCFPQDSCSLVLEAYFVNKSEGSLMRLGSLYLLPLH